LSISSINLCQIFGEKVLINAKKALIKLVLVKRITINCDFFLSFSALLYGVLSQYAIMRLHEQMGETAWKEY